MSAFILILILILTMTASWVHAEEIINIFALAIRLGLNTTDIKDAILSYPTNSSDIGYML